MKTILTLATALTLLTIAAPVASAGPQCLQVYPWSELCQGDVEGFLEGMGVDPVVTVDCIQVYPWSELCQGDVVSFVCYYVQCDVSVLA